MIGLDNQIYAIFSDRMNTKEFFDIDLPNTLYTKKRLQKISLDEVHFIFTLSKHIPGDFIRGLKELTLYNTFLLQEQGLIP